jgi:hypothetical protein
MSEPFEQQTGGAGSMVHDSEGIGPHGKQRFSSIDKAIVKPLLSRKDVKRKDDNQTTCCCFDPFRKRTSSEQRKECEDRKRGFLYWCVTILAL